MVPTNRCVPLVEGRIAFLTWLAWNPMATSCSTCLALGFSDTRCRFFSPPPAQTPREGSPPLGVFPQESAPWTCSGSACRHSHQQLRRSGKPQQQPRGCKSRSGPQELCEGKGSRGGGPAAKRLGRFPSGSRPPLCAEPGDWQRQGLPSCPRQRRSCGWSAEAFKGRQEGGQNPPWRVWWGPSMPPSAERSVEAQGQLPSYLRALASACSEGFRIQRTCSGTDAQGGPSNL